MYKVLGRLEGIGRKVVEFLFEQRGVRPGNPDLVCILKDLVHREKETFAVGVVAAEYQARIASDNGRSEGFLGGGE